MSDPATRVLVVAGNRLHVVDGAVAWVTPDLAPDGTRVLLGERDDVVHLAVLVAPDEAPGWHDTAEMATTSAESVALSKALKRHGFAFVGPTTMYALMEAIGIFDPHLLGCFRRGSG